MPEVTKLYLWHPLSETWIEAQCDEHGYLKINASALDFSDLGDMSHHETHELEGADPIKLDDLSVPDDTTDLDATPSLHGLMSKVSQEHLESIEPGADVTDPESVEAAGAVMETDFNAATFLYAVEDNIPLPNTPAEVMAILSGQAAADFSMNTNKITGVTDPTTDQDVATKKYVDDLPSGPTFTELTGGQDVNPAAADTWQDWDLSAIVPAGTSSVLVLVENMTSYGDYSGARKKGTGAARFFKTRQLSSVVVLTECDSNRVIEIYKYALNKAFSIIGYWK